MTSTTSDKPDLIPPVAVVVARLKDLDLERKALQHLLQAAVKNESRKYAGDENARRGG